jgi:peptide/nickel transport system permease protein
MNIMLAIPGLLLAMLLVAGLSPSLRAVILAVGIGGTPGFARLARTVLVQLRQADYIVASETLGANWLWKTSRHLLPNARPQLLALGTIHFAWSLLSTTTLTFLGLAGDPSLPEWGSMLNASRTHLAEAPWLAFLPGMLISLTILAVHELGRRMGQPVRAQRE